MGCLRERKRKPTLEIRELLRLNKAHCIQAIVIDELSKKSYLQHLQPCDGTGSNSSHQFGYDRPWLHFCSYQSSCRICPLKNKTNCSLCFMSNFQLKISKHKPNSHIFLQRVIAYIVLFKLWFFFLIIAKHLKIEFVRWIILGNCSLKRTRFIETSYGRLSHRWSRTLWLIIYHGQRWDKC